MQALYTAEAKASGSGRNGEVVSSDGILDEGLAVPQDMGGPGGQNTNPEQLFAAGYAACFHGALDLVAGQSGQDISGSDVTAQVTIGKDEADGFGLGVRIMVSLPGMDDGKANELAAQAHSVCPYSKATKGNIAVDVETKT